MEEATDCMTGAILGIVVPYSIDKEAVLAMMSKPICSTLHGLCTRFCIKVPALLNSSPTAFDDEQLQEFLSEVNPFLHKLLFVLVFHYSNINPY